MRTLVLRVASMAALALASLASPAAAQDPDQPAPGTFVLGPVRIVPSFLIRDMGVDNNVKNEAVDPKSDFTMTLVPRALTTLRMRRLRASADLATDYVYYKKYSEEGGTNASITGRVEMDLGRLRPYALAQGIDTKARPNAEIDARARHHDVMYGAGTSLSIASRTRLLVNATTRKVAYDAGEAFRGVELQQTLNGRHQSIEAGVALDLTPLTSLSVLATREQERFALAPERDANSWRIGPTLTFSPDGLLSGTAGIGYRHFDTVSPLLPDYSGLVASVGVSASIYGRHQLRVNANRDVQYSYDEATQYYVSTGFGGSWTMTIVGPFDVRLMGTRTRMDYRADGTTDAGDDTFVSYGGGLGYHVTSRLRVGVDTEWLRRTSTRGAEREYENHRLFAGLTWGVR